MSDTAKDKIIGVAQQLFSKKGYEATSIRDIATEADVNVSSINYYFGSKQGLFEFLVEDFTNKKFSLVVAILEPPSTMEEFKLRLSMFVKQFLLLNKEDRNSFLMVNKNIDVFLQMAPEKFQSTFLKIHHQFLGFIKESQDQKILRPEFPAEVVTQILFGGLVDAVRGQDLRKHFGVSVTEESGGFEAYAKVFVEIFINGMGGAKSDS